MKRMAHWMLGMVEQETLVRALLISFYLCLFFGSILFLGGTK